MRRARHWGESLVGFVIGALLGMLPFWGLPILGGIVDLLPVRPDSVQDWAAGVTPWVTGCIGAAVQFHAYKRATKLVVRRLFTIALVLAFSGLVALTQMHDAVTRKVEFLGGSVQEVWTVGFGERLPSCDCAGLGDEDCIRALVEPDAVVSCWGRSAIQRGMDTLRAIYLMFIIGAAGLLGLSVMQVLARQRVLQVELGALPERVLERVIRQSNLFHEPAKWRARLATIERQVCRIDINGQPRGTGFLIGADLVLTNHHVIAPVLNGHVSPEKVEVLFDYAYQEDGLRLREPRSCRLAPQWQVDASPPSTVDLRAFSESQVPSEDELDHAVLRITERLGDEPAAEGPRGWIDLPRRVEFTAGDPLIIVQHPEGRPLQLTIDTDAIVGTNSNRTRIRYRTNTLPGSSGSPCFDASLCILALHHSGDPQFTPTYNAGIPIDRLRQRLEAKGIPLQEAP